MPLVREFRSLRPDAQIMLTRVSDPRQLGVAELDEAGQVVRLMEKPPEPRVCSDVDEGPALIGRMAIEGSSRVAKSRVVSPFIHGMRTRVLGSYAGLFTAVAADGFRPPAGPQVPGSPGQLEGERCRIACLLGCTR